MITEKYPDAYDVSELINLRSTALLDVRHFAAGKGLLVAGRGKNDYAKPLSRLLLDHKSYLALRYFAQGGSGSTRISGFNIRDFSTPKKTLQQLYNDLMRLRQDLAEQKQTQKVFSTLEMKPPTIDGDFINSEYTYEKMTPGKIELLSRSQQTVQFSISQIQDGIWEVICLPDFNQDVETLQKLLSRVDRKSFDVYSITLETFQVSDRISFFDRLLAYYNGVSDEWRLRQVCGIVVKQPDSEEPDQLFQIDSDVLLSEIINDETAEKQVAPSDLRSINQAALEGRNLRTNSFVINCLREGFYFSSLSLEIENKKTPEVIKVQVRFKFNPKLFEVILLYAATMTSVGEQESKLSPEREKQILSEIWDISHKIWHEINANLPASSLEGRQTMMNLSA